MITVAYSKEGPHGDEYVFRRNGEIQFAAPEISLCFSVTEGQRCILHKHGHPQAVQRWFEESIARIESARAATPMLTALYQEMIDEFRIITSDNWDVDDLNKIINNTGHLTSFMKQFNPEVLNADYVNVDPREA